MRKKTGKGKGVTNICVYVSAYLALNALSGASARAHNDHTRHSKEQISPGGMISVSNLWLHGRLSFAFARA